MQIELLSKIKLSKNMEHICMDVWKRSRSLNDDTMMEAIQTTDGQITEMPRAVISVRSSIIEREIIASLRSISIWARSSRVDGITDWEPEPLLISQQNEKEFKGMKHMAEEAMKDGESKNRYRMYMPIGLQTSFCCSIDLRSAVKLVLYFENWIIENPDNKLNLLFGVAAEEIKEKVIKELCDFPVEILSKMSTYEILPEPENFETGLVGDIFSITNDANISLRTHAIRHRPLIVKDNLKSILLNNPEPALISLNHPCRLQLSGEKTFWESLVSKRSCWMAHYDLWSRTITKAIDELGFGNNVLPCTEKMICPYEKDAHQRLIEYEEAGCPRYSILHGISVSEKDIEDMFFQIKDEKRPKFWFKEINQLSIKNLIR